MPKLLLDSCFPTIGDGSVPFECSDSTEEFESRCFRFFSNSSISERMLKRSSLDVGVLCRRSGRVTAEPSMNLEGRRARSGLVGGERDIVVFWL